MTLKKPILIVCGIVFFIGGVATAVILRKMHAAGPGDHAQHAPDARFDLWQAVFQTPDGEAARLSASFANRPLMLVNFWATWCAPCLAEMPLLNAAAAEPDGNAAIVGISYEAAAEVAPFLEKLNIQYDVLLSSSDIFYFFQEHSNRGGVLPFTVLINQDGEILRQKIGEFKTVEEINAFIDG